MDKKIGLPILGLAVIILMVGVFLAGKNNSSRNTAGNEQVGPALENTSADPKKVVEEFYAAWVTYEGNPMADGLYKENDAITEQLESNLDETIASNEAGGGGADPVLCAQDKPAKLEYQLRESGDGQATVGVTAYYAGVPKQIAVGLREDDGQWKLNEISCTGETGKTGGPDLSVEQQNLIGDYIRENISEISPDKEVLGGKFYITKIIFENNESALIEYEDGHNAFLARVRFSLSGGQVKVEGVERLSI